MKHNVIAPNVGESITEVSILKWHKKDGQAVKEGELLLEIESDKATVEVVAEHAGVLQTLKPEGERLPVGTPIGVIDDAATPTAAASQPATATPARAAPSAIPPVAAQAPQARAAAPSSSSAGSGATLSPAVRKLVDENNVDPSKVSGTGKDGRLTKGDVLQHLSGAGSGASAGAPAAAPAQSAPAAQPAVQAPRREADRPGDRRVAMSMLRSRIAERLVQAQHTAAILTTFNECDMSAVMALRNQHKDAFKAKHGVSLGFMSFFVKACIEGLKAVPEVNASIDGRDVIYHDYFDIGVAVGTERGLVVPVVRDTDKLTFAGIEQGIVALANKARDGKLSIADMTGGTFTISNGGVYGSLLSTPILNMPQSGILGMHKIMERPMVVNGKIEARPMMYLALSYDHRLIDGKGAVTFLVKVKECIENPALLNPEF